MNQETKFCLSCGKEIPFAASYCPYCGKPQVGLENQPSSPSPTLKQRTPVAASQRQLWYKNWMIWAIIVLGVGLVICIALLNSAKTTVVMQPAASSKTAKTKAKAKKKDPNQVSSNPLIHLSKVGQWKNSEVLGKISMTGLGTKPDTTIQNGPLSVKFKHAEIDKVHANTEDQLDQALTSFNKDSMPKDYTRMKIEYVVTNHSTTTIDFGGIKQIVFSNGYQINFDDDAMADTGSEEELAPHAKRVEYDLVLISESTTTLKPKSIKIITDESDDSKSLDTVSDGSSFSESISYQA
ncbi:zinc ribbon domain-containing protein [Lentilactobacillus buchneri]|uniref:zinc ribbon domain-containing protein n=1 Tax=Lentilactobacillus buchneri TaxID=1581 RepID=UPI0012927F21|nr:zinc ribbon domain-containing protein [Lentilactobacillus buchneri]MQM60243.1 zinc ribbon domain-containing protein [Lentilactobacillus buchneri]MQM79932.1 zinc ribbon domain-containing protein [Lentilactobacillus buchneri]